MKQQKSAVLMRVLMNRYYKGSPESFLKSLPEEEIKEILSIDIPSNQPAAVLKNPLEKIRAIHYSWFTPLIEKMPKEVQAVILAAFPEDYARKLSNALKITVESKPLLPFVKTFLIEKLLKRLEGVSDVLPKEFLPQTALSPLGNLNKNELAELVEFLGLHDLADELRYVVDQKTLKRVYGCLNPNELHYLKFCMQQKEKVAAPALGLERWGGDCEKLKKAMQSRGMMRLGKALSGEHPDFLWHLVHTFDRGRGQALGKYCSQKALTGITPALTQQTLNLVNILKRKSEA